jgi:hypothetical protein
MPLNYSSDLHLAVVGGDYNRYVVRGPLMERVNEENWEELCRQVANDEEREKILALITDIKNLCDANETGLKTAPPFSTKYF